MPNDDDPVFWIRSLGEAEYVVEVRWPDGTVEQAAGVYPLPDQASGWIDDAAKSGYEIVPD
jgi:hypothetical protein